MEVAGVALGLLPVFSICLEYFQLFKTVQDAPIASQVLLFKFDCEHERFTIWGEKHGLAEEPGRKRNPQLDEPGTAAKISRALHLIHQRLSDTKDLQDKYGIGVSDMSTAAAPKPLDAATRPYLSDSGLKRFSRLASRRKEQPRDLSFIRQTKWAIRDKVKFEGLVTDVQELVERLYELVPVPEKERDTVAAQDIRSLSTDLEQLKILEQATAEKYPSWSSTASMVHEIASTWEGGSVVSRWVSQVDDTQSSASPVESEQDGLESVLDGKIAGFPNYTRVVKDKTQADFMCVFTAMCRSGADCDPGFPTPENEINYAHVHEDDSQRRWGLSRLIREMIEEAYAPNETSAFKVCLYCPPCKSSIHTAIHVARQNTKLRIPYKIRIDGRIPCWCCTKDHVTHRIRGWVQLLMNFDINITESRNSPDYTEYLDKRWMEQSLFSLESLRMSQPYLQASGQSESPDKQTIMEVDSFLADVMLASGTQVPILFGEARICSWIFLRPPFPIDVRAAREDESFRYTLKKGSDVSKGVLYVTEYRGTFTSNPQVAQDMEA